MINIAQMLASFELDNKKFKAGIQDMIVDSKKLQTQLLSLGKQGIGNLVGNLGALKSNLFSLKSAFAALGLGYIARDTIKVGAAFNELRLSLDAVTKGHGAEWFERLNLWALKMPINTEKAIEAFKNMTAMGFQPATEQMTLLVDATMALGGGTATLEGIARAIGQISAKGSVKLQELYQLANRGIPAFEILSEKLGLTLEQVANIGESGVSAHKAIKALFEGMTERYGGLSEQLMKKYTGLMETIIGYWREFQRLVMDSGLMNYIEGVLSLIVDKMNVLFESGGLKDFAENTSTTIIETFKKMSLGTADFIDRISGIAEVIWGEVTKLWDAFLELPPWIRNIGIVGALFTGKEGWAAMIAVLYLVDKINENVKRSQDNYIKWAEKNSQYFTSSQEQADALIQKMRDAANEEEETLERLGSIGVAIVDSYWWATQEALDAIEKSAVKSSQVIKKVAVESKEAITDTLAWKIASLGDFEELIFNVYGRTKEEQIKFTKEQIKSEKDAAETASETWLEYYTEQAKAQETWAQGWKRGLTEIKEEFVNWGIAAYKTVFALSSAGHDLFKNVFVDAAKGELKSFGDYLADFWNNMLNAWADILAQMAVQWILAHVFMQEATGGLFSGFGATASGGVGVAGGGVTSGAITQVASGLGWGVGAIGAGSAVPAYATGSIVEYAAAEAAMGVNAIGAGSAVEYAAAEAAMVEAGGFMTALGPALGAAGLGFMLGSLIFGSEEAGIGSALGAGIGFALGGPIGALIGGLGGGALGSLFQEGTPYVSETGPAYVHEGERILSATDNRMLISAVKSMGDRPIYITLTLDGEVLSNFLYEGTKTGRIHLHERSLTSR